MSALHPCGGSGSGRCAGVALVEALIALTLSGLLIAAMTSALVGMGRLALAQAGTVAAAETQRLVRHVVVREVAPLLPTDVLAGFDSLDIRAVRGVGVVCARTARGGSVWYRGQRAPDASKDSVIVLAADERRLELSAAPAGGECAPRPGHAAYRVVVDTALDAGTVLLFFERGQYFLADEALRYRRGAAGRQPLTEANVVDSASGFDVRALPAGIRVSARLGTRLSMQPGGEAVQEQTHIAAWPGMP